ncbi:MAG: hypothetical protein KDJ16_05620 [Hyphomicrobiales bacterium]|nr:hypothetical protein [Hyphomicrobiales bacterium]
MQSALPRGRDGQRTGADVRLHHEEGTAALAKNHLKFGDRRFVLPASRIFRIAIGLMLIAAGFFGFLPVLGFWMVPLGLIVLSIDIPWVRRLRRRAQTAIERRRRVWNGEPVRANHDGPSNDKGAAQP